MSVERTFKCNLCHTGFDAKDARLVGINWTGKTFVYARTTAVENHLCADCIASAHKLFTEARSQGHSIDAIPTVTR